MPKTFKLVGDRPAAQQLKEGSLRVEKEISQTQPINGTLR